MVTMTSSSPRPPAGMEYKGAATMLAPTPTAPTPDTATVTSEGVVELIAAVTGIQDDVGDIIRPGAFRRTIAERRPKVCSNHRWDAPIGRVLDIKELLPGDPRLPRTTGDGRAWPRAAGALVATAAPTRPTAAAGCGGGRETGVRWYARLKTTGVVFLLDLTGKRPRRWPDYSAPSASSRRRHCVQVTWTDPGHGDGRRPRCRRRGHHVLPCSGMPPSVAAPVKPPMPRAVPSRTVKITIYGCRTRLVRTGP